MSTGSAAAIDVGSNTVHMLLARMDASQLEPLADQSLLIGLAQDVYASGRIGPRRLAEVADAVASLVQRARTAGAEKILLVATAAVRDAANHHELAAAVRERSGLDLQVIDGEREAALTYRGAVSGEGPSSASGASEQDTRRQVCDVGGGSTEIIRAEGDTITLQTSLPFGSSRLSRAFSADPPVPDEVMGVYEQVTQAVAALPRWRPDRLIVTGGTAAALMRLAGGQGRRYEMPIAGLDGLRTLLAQYGSHEIAERYVIDAGRARLLPAGAAIIAALCASAEADTVVLTASGLRDGMLVEYFSGSLHG